MKIVCVTPEGGGGWAPVTRMAALAASLFEADLILRHPRKQYSVARRALSVLPRLRGRETVLAIVAQPGDMIGLVDAGWLSGRYGQVAVWIIDSFWDDRIPRMARATRSIDQLFVTDEELVDHYAQVAGVPTTWLPWGTDVLALDPESFRDRPTDVLRLGRQPHAWDDDAANEAVLNDHGLSYRGRFPVQSDAAANQRAVADALASAKVVLASSNAASPAPYTHPTREYISARWCDAAAAGAIVAGQVPNCGAARLLPRDGLVDLAVTSQVDGVSQLAAAVRTWTPQLARRLNAHARVTLDWRLRFEVVADQLGLAAPQLRLALNNLREPTDA